MRIYMIYHSTHASCSVGHARCHRIPENVNPDDFARKAAQRSANHLEFVREVQQDVGDGGGPMFTVGADRLSGPVKVVDVRAVAWESGKAVFGSSASGFETPNWGICA